MTLTAETPGSTTCRPRFATPRDEQFPTLGTTVGEVARRLSRPLMRWQQEQADVGLEYDPETGLLRYDEVDGTVPRQSGKTTLILAKKVTRLTVMARQWGPQRSTYTAQTRLAARKKLERDFAEILRGSRAFREVANAKARPSKPTEWRLSLNNGSEAIQFGAGSFLQIDAPSRTGGHGDTLDDGTIDEAFAHEDDTVEAAMRPAMATRRNAQLWVISTAGDERSKYLWRKVVAGRAASIENRHGRVCYTEYSAPDDADPGDPQTWFGCMPALHRLDCPAGCREHTTTVEFVQGEWERAQRKGQEGIDTFCRAYLNMWPNVPILDELGGQGGFDFERFKTLADPATPPPGSPGVGHPAFAVATAPDRSWSAVAAAWIRADLNRHVILDDYRPGTAWVAERVAELQQRWGGAVTVNTAARGLVPGADEPSQVDQARAHNDLGDAVEAGTMRHGNEPALLLAARAAKWKPSGDSRVLDRKGRAEISPLDAAALALHALNDTTSSGGWVLSL